MKDLSDQTGSELNEQDAAIDSSALTDKSPHFSTGTKTSLTTETASKRLKIISGTMSLALKLVALSVDLKTTAKHISFLLKMLSKSVFSAS